MATRDVQEFLQEFPEADLKERGILRGTTSLLMGQSIDALLALMKEHGVTRLESLVHDWFLDVNGHFRNRRSEEVKEGRVGELERRGNVFNYMNTSINPFYRVAPAEDSLEAAREEAQEIRFGLERDMQRALRSNIAQLEAGLIIADGGTERRVSAGHIDITAKDRDGNAVAIELKAGRAGEESIAQILAYMASLEAENEGPVRGILVAFEFPDRVRWAARAVPNLRLTQYAFAFSFAEA